MFNTYLKTDFAGQLIGEIAVLSPPMKIALWIGNPGVDTIDGAEVSGGAYARKSTLNSQWDQSGGVLTNNTEFAFAEATAYWGVVTYVVMMGSDDWPWFYGPLTAPKEIDEGSTAKFKIGTLSITLL